MQFWCANFEHEKCLQHGVTGGFWMMHSPATDKVLKIVSEQTGMMFMKETREVKILCVGAAEK